MLTFKQHLIEQEQLDEFAFPLIPIIGTAFIPWIMDISTDPIAVQAIAKSDAAGVVWDLIKDVALVAWGEMWPVLAGFAGAYVLIKYAPKFLKWVYQTIKYDKIGKELRNDKDVADLFVRASKDKKLAADLKLVLVGMSKENPGMMKRMTQDFIKKAKKDIKMKSKIDKEVNTLQKA